MKQILLLSLCIILFSAAVPWKWASPFGVEVTNTYYVSFTDGNDNNTTTQAKNPATPWKTLSKLNALMSAGTIANGDSVLLKAGDSWAGDTLTVSKGINLNSYGSGAQPNISGFYTVTSWTSIGGGVYESEAMPTGATVNMVTINNKVYAMGRTPNANAANGGYLTYASVGSGYIVDNTNPFTATYNNATLVMRIKHYIIERSTVTSISGNAISYSPATASTPTAGFGYFMENSLVTLDQFGEWYYNPTTHKIDVYFGSSVPTGTTVKVSAKGVLITPTASNVTINNLHLEGANTYGIWNWNGGVTGLAITNCTILCSGIDAISMENRANLDILNCTISWANGNGICMANKDDRPFIDNNDISNICLFPGMLQRSQFSSNRYGNGILHIPSSGFYGMQCTNNRLRNIGMHGIFLDGDSMHIYNNTVDSFCMTLDDAGGIYTGNTSLLTRKGIEIVGNIVSHGIGAHFGTDGTKDFAEGIYLDDGTNNVLVQSNTSYSNSSTGFFIHNARKNTLKYNTSFNNFQQLAIIHGTQVSITLDSNILIGDTLFCMSAGQLVQYRAKDQTQNESFASYTLQSNSNVFCSPFTSEANMIQTNWFGHSQVINYNLATWKTATGLDALTTVTPATITDPTNIIFYPNSGKLARSLRFCAACLGVNSANYTKRVAVAPMSSIIIIKK